MLRRSRRLNVSSMDFALHVALRLLGRTSSGAMEKFALGTTAQAADGLGWDRLSQVDQLKILLEGNYRQTCVTKGTIQFLGFY